MGSQGKVNVFMIALGAVTILLCAFVGLLSAPAYLGILGGVALIWAAFPPKRPIAENDSQTDIDTTATSTGMDLKLD